MTIDALWTSTAGLRATQASIGVVSQNVANAGTAGYVRRRLDTVAGGNDSGVAVGTVARTLDAAAQKQLRLETAGAAYTATRAGVAGQLDRLYGTPGSSTSLDAALDGFTASLQDLSANPTTAAARAAVLSAASALSGRINAAAASVQGLRTGIEAQLTTDTADAGALLKSIAGLNVKIQGASESARADLLDQRDRAIDGLSSYFDVQAVEQRDGTVSVLTGSGVTLVDRGSAATLGFDGRGTLSPASAYAPDPARRTVGTITATTPGGAKIDLSAPGALRSGSMAAQLELRDATLPQAQRQLDDLAAGLASALTDKRVAGTVSGGAATVDLAGIQAGNALTLPVTAPDGSVRNVVLIASNGATRGVAPALTDDAGALAQTFDISGGPATYATGIRAALAALSSRAAAAGTPNVPSLTAGGSGSTVTVSGSGGFAVSAASADITVPASAGDLASGYPRLPLFVDGSGDRLFTDSFEGGSQRTGLAQRLSVNAVLAANPAALTASGATDPTASGSRAQFVLDALTAGETTFSSSSGIGGVAAPHTATVAGFMRDVIAAQGAASATAAALDDGQQVALSTAQGRFATTAGVNIDEEMSNLIALQTAYGANARVLTAARDMLDRLLQI